MFISSYTAICFFAKKFAFLNACISVNTIFESLYMFFWLTKGPLIKYVHNWLGNGGSKIRTATYRGRGFHASCVPTHLHYLFSCFWLYFCLVVSCSICIILTLALFEKDVFVRNGYFFPTRSFFCNEISLFYLKLFLPTKVS